jgi:type II secretory pathway pseudopilin PulG
MTSANIAVTEHSGIHLANRMGRARRARYERGTSLIEIMVVLVILLVGIFLAVRIFPGGFGILRSNSNRTLATQFAQQQLAELRADGGSLPQGVLATSVDPVNGSLIFASNVDTDNLSPCRQILNGDKPDVADSYFNPCDDRDIVPEPSGKPTTALKNTYFADVNKFRYIKGEGVKVPLPTIGAYGSGSIYAAKFGPMFMNQLVGEPGNVPTTDAERAIFNSYLRVTGAPLIGINGDSGDANLNPNSLIRNQQTYVIDYGNDGGGVLIYLPPRGSAGRATPYRTFSITLTYVLGNDVGTGDADPVTINDGDAGWKAVTVKGVAITSAAPGSETVTRDFNRLAATTDWDVTDPYQYKLLSPNILTNQTSEGAGSNSYPTYANAGVLAFNPSGANYTETGPNGQQPFRAYLDYAVLDWHILRDTREVPSAIPVKIGGVNLIPIRTTLALIKKRGSDQGNATAYNGIYGSASDDIQVFNLSQTNGASLASGRITDTTLSATDKDYYINDDERGGTYRTGTIYINPARVPVGSKLRILYKAEGDWAVAVQKAFTTYRLTTLPNNPNVPAEFPEEGRYNGFALSGSAAAAEIRFPLADFNKSFVVTLQYTTRDGRIRRLPPIQMTANKRSKGVKQGGYDDRWSAIQVRDYLPLTSRSEFASAQNWQVAGNISGVSIKSRAIWRDNDSTENRWRLQDMDAYLTPGQ